MILNKFTYLLRLRFYQIRRMLQSVGWVLLSVFLVISVGISFPLLNNILEASHWWSFPGCLIIIIVLDVYRKDKLFLRTIFRDHKTLLVYLAVEYTLVTMPIWLYQLFNNLETAFIVLMSCWLVAWLSRYFTNREHTSTKKTLKFIPISLFELKFFIERNPISWSLFWLTGVTSMIHIGIYIFWMFILLMSIPELFRYYESRDMLHWKNGFVFDKIRKYTTVFFLITLVHTLTAFFFHTDMYLVVLYLNLCLFSVIILNIVMKYAGYSPLFHAGAVSNINGILTIIMLFPGGVIITIGYSMWKYFEAEKNLKTFYA